MNRIPIPLHPTAYGLALACPQWPAILAELHDALRRGRSPWQVRGLARASVRTLHAAPLDEAVMLGLIDDFLGWEEGRAA